MRRRAAALTGAVLALASLAFASNALGDERVSGVVELFTSQGCSSCPPADAVLTELAGREDVLALGYHIDYWDYLGWRDTLGSRRNTERQYAYRKALGNRSVYTPQAVVNGVDHANGAHHAKIETILERTAQDTASVSLEHGDNSLEIALSGNAQGSADVMIVYFSRSTEVEVGRGENRGRTLRYANAVREFKTIGMWRGGDDRISMPIDEVAKAGADGCAVIVQHRTATGEPGRIIAADRIYLDVAG